MRHVGAWGVCDKGISYSTCFSFSACWCTPAKPLILGLVRAWKVGPSHVSESNMYYGSRKNWQYHSLGLLLILYYHTPDIRPPPPKKKKIPIIKVPMSCYSRFVLALLQLNYELRRVCEYESPCKNGTFDVYTLPQTNLHQYYPKTTSLMTRYFGPYKRPTQAFQAHPTYSGILLTCRKPKVQ